MSKELALAAFEDFIMGKKGTFKLVSPTAAEKESDAKAVVRYVVTSMLRWTPEVTMRMLHDDDNLFKKLHFDMLVKYFYFPEDVDPKQDRGYIVYCSFYREKGYAANQVLTLYDHICKGELYRFPSKFFNGFSGQKKASILLKKYISEHVGDANPENLYKFFADSGISTKLKKAHLFDAATAVYQTPLEFLHHSLDQADGKSDFLFSVYEYLGVENNVRKKMKAEKKAAEKEKAAKATNIT